MSEIKVNKISPKQTCTQVTLGDSGDDIIVASGVNFKTPSVKDASGNIIISRCGSNITIGSSGASIALACGASQTGFGRTGTVDWDTTAKTASFTAVSGNGYFVNTTSGAITVTLPSSPSAGDIVSISDYANTSNTNNITVARNGSNIEGAASDLVIENNGVAMTFVYVDGTKGWKVTNAGNQTDRIPGALFIAATGGTITCCGDYKIHTFTGPGTFTVSCAGNAGGSNSVDYLVVAGGAGGGASRGGGGGAGGYRESSGVASGCYTTSPLGSCVSALPVTAQGYPITVGGGGAGGTPPSTQGVSGSNSILSTITSAGGGGGGSYVGITTEALDGGSGGGQRSGYNPSAIGPVGGAGNTPPVSPPQGNTGGAGFDGLAVSTQGGGGGGATAVGGNALVRQGGAGGAGATSSINATPTARAGGGGGGTDGGNGTFQAGSPPSLGGSGGTGGGGAGNPNIPSATPSGTSGTTNTGGGGGGGGTSTGANGGAGGSGIVIIRYKFQ